MTIEAGGFILRLADGEGAKSIPGNVVFLDQCHSSLVIHDPQGGEAADGMTVPRGGSLPGLKVADCLPLFALWDNYTGAVHAGWRGLAGGIVGNLLLSVDEPLRHLIAGPCICACCYSVGPDVRLAVSRGDPGGTAGHPPGRVDLSESAFRRAEAVCGRDFKRHRMDICTLENPALHSYRRNGTVSRNLLWLAPEGTG